MNRERHIEFSAKALKTFKDISGTGDKHAIADLICDLGHLADAQGVEFLKEIERGVGHWCAERDTAGAEATAAAGQPHVEIKVRPRK